ncbi:hypothetical protein [Reichenbachiella versicolor]|uniref:hypothetical protein n=1 Tax=Reichenbachiella versicolor TaxID=1821036 RepID=UPI000D6E0800|nr:hypothetical protein [Reichenbachiella versicolor]
MEDRFENKIAEHVRLVIREELIPVMAELMKLEVFHDMLDDSISSKVKRLDLVTLEEAAHILDCSISTVLRNEKKGFYTRVNQVPFSKIMYKRLDIKGFMGFDN